MEQQEVNLQDVRVQAIIKDLEGQRNSLGARAAETAGELEVARILNVAMTQSLGATKAEAEKYRKFSEKLTAALKRHSEKSFKLSAEELQKVLDSINDVEIVL